ncbi:MAG: ATP-binding cassette domain-containing protein [Magnetococcales bacterium]|nr:ATP-binding cassette domain-containing protein [Magnetococcales bacterium]
MVLATLKDITVSFGGHPVLEGVDLVINSGERIGLVGANGSGKTTLMRVIGGELGVDAGGLAIARGRRVARLEQEVPGNLEGTVFTVVASGLAATADPETDPGEENNNRVEAVISRMGLPGAVPFADLSGGFKRRVLLARLLVSAPDLLLLDEPTNHLDVATIEWLEGFLPSFPGTILFVTHDRMFLERLATRIIDLDRGRLTDWPGNYRQYRERREALLAAEEQAEAQFDRKLADEEVWIRQGIKARRTRNEGRVRALERLRAERRQRREPPRQAKIRLEAGDRSGHLVLEAEDLAFDYHGKPCIQNLTTRIMRGDKVGILGPNGAGKTTLLQLFLGRLEPTSGSVRQGTRLEVAFFDQLRAGIDGNATVADNVANGRERVEIGGQSRHIIGYLRDFLFSPDRARTPARVLSGGERNRLLLAKLFLEPANLLVLDEPTNDLDAETLELLEARLVDYTGTLLLVSHDRTFLNNVVTTLLVFEEDQRVVEYVGGYDDWLAQRPNSPPRETRRPEAEKKAERPRTARPRKLNFAERRELETLPDTIQSLENERDRLHAHLADPLFYKGPGDAIAAATTRLGQLETELESAFRRWEELEQIPSG